MTLRQTLVALPLALCACFPRSAPPPTALSPAQVSLGQLKRDPPVSEEQLELGRKVFVAECGECHGHPDLTYIPQSKWPKTLAQMTDKANLSKEQTAQVTVFVETAAEAANAPK